MTPLVLLHGFTGNAQSWDEVMTLLPADRRVLRVNLTGHDPTAASSTSAVFQDEVDRIAELIATKHMQGAHLCGYSMGGRVALALIVHHAELFSKATLVAANPGVRTSREREERAVQEGRWIDVLETQGVEAFVQEWEGQPMFASQRQLPEERLATARRIRLQHDPRGLSRALRVLGVSAMPDYWPRLTDIKVPIQVISGSEDSKYCAIATQIMSELNSRMQIITGAGHNLILERPVEIANILIEGDQHG